MIAGPGGPWVQEAKLQVSRQVGIDGYAGPSELMVICDGGANAEWIALDLCAQAEHGADGPLVVAATDGELLERIGARVEELAARSAERRRRRASSWSRRPTSRPRPRWPRRSRPSTSSSTARAPTSSPSSVTTAGCIFVGPFAGNRLRRLRGRLQPHPSDRRRRALHRPARPEHLHAPASAASTLDGEAAAALRRHGRRDRPRPRASPCTASRQAPARRHGPADQSS